MKASPSPIGLAPTKASTGVTGFDEITGGGLPCGRTTLLVGGPGSGKTILALQFLVHGARNCAEPGIFVAFEETSARIVANAQGFGWSLPALRRKKLFFLDAQPMPDLVQSGDFDLGGMLAALEAQVQEMGARRIVFDALDLVLALLPGVRAKRRELYCLHQWMLARELTGVITAKADADETVSVHQEPFRSMLFMEDCAVILSHILTLGVSQRKLRVQKYRGSSFDENESPFLIGRGGLEVAVAHTLQWVVANGGSERVSSGVKALDEMLGGGYLRGASVLVSGSPGTAKTTLSGAFAQSACARGEHSLFVSFDSDVSEVVRNLASVGIDLDSHLKTGCLRMVSVRTITGSAEAYLVHIKTLAQTHAARCVVIDPLTLSRTGDELSAHSVAVRLIDWSKAEGITLVCTSRQDEMSSQREDGSPPRISTLADTWIDLSYLVQADQRHRGLSVIKSRGTAHSNRIRELVLSDAGVSLIDTTSADGEVSMGTRHREEENARPGAPAAGEVVAKPKRAATRR